MKTSRGFVHPSFTEKPAMPYALLWIDFLLLLGVTCFSVKKLGGFAILFYGSLTTLHVMAIVKAA